MNRYTLETDIHADPSTKKIAVYESFKDVQTGQDSIFLSQIIMPDEKGNFKFDVSVELKPKIQAFTIFITAVSGNNVESAYSDPVVFTFKESAGWNLQK